MIINLLMVTAFIVMMRAVVCDTTNHKRKATTSELWRFFNKVHLNALERCKISNYFPYKPKICVEIAYLSLKRHFKVVLNALFVALLQNQA